MKTIVVHRSCFKDELGATGVVPERRAFLQTVNAEIARIMARGPVFRIDRQSYIALPEPDLFSPELISQLRGAQVLEDEVSAMLLQRSGVLPHFLNGEKVVGLAGIYGKRCVAAVGRVLTEFPITAIPISNAIAD